MNRNLLIIALILIVLAVLIAAFAFMHKPQNGGASGNPFGFTASPSGTSLPNGGTGGGGTPPVERTVTFKDGSQATIPDVTKLPQPAWASSDNGYVVSGNGQGDFDILYYPAQSAFSITLLQEPLGQTRLAAEQALRATLKLTDTQLCKLSADIGTIGSVNETYAGRNLGLSFCPGSVKLP